MTGSEIALATLMRAEVHEPCINYSWMTSSSYLSRAAGRDYWADPEAVFFAYLRHCGINLVPQYYFPGEAQRNIECGHPAHEHRPGGSAGIRCTDDILRAVESLPEPAVLERDFDLEGTAAAYATALTRRIDRTGGQTLFIDGFGQADFMGPYTSWGYENYLVALADHPAAVGRYYHHTAVAGRLLNHAIVRAQERYGIAPFVYGGQDICGSRGPIAAPSLLRRLYFPALAYAIEPLVDHGIGIIWHCDGNISPIIDDLLALGLVGLQGFEEEHGVDYADLAGRRGRDGRLLSIWGSVSVTSTLPFGTPDDVRRAVERSFRVAGAHRGFVLSSTSSVMPEVPHANIDALFDHGRRFGREFLA
jgi:hypothetical protein